MERLLISSLDVAYDMSCLKKYAVTHILNVAAALPNAFKSDVRYIIILIKTIVIYMYTG